MARKIYFTAGPTEIYFTLEGHLKKAMNDQVPSISHRGAQFKTIYKETSENIRSLLNLPDEYKILFTSSATEIWEHTVRNCVERESFHFVNGAFSKKFAQFSKNLGMEAGTQEFPGGSCPTPESWRIPESAELIGLALNESSTGVAFPVEYFKELRLAGEHAMIAVDGVSSIPVPTLDYSLVDIAYFSVQKCFGLPAGLGVWIVGPRTIEKATKLNENGKSRVTYRSLVDMIKKSEDNQTLETPNVLGIYLLGKVAEDMNRKGLDVIRRESKYKAAVLGQMIENLDWLSHFVEIPQHRSETVIAAKCSRPTSDIISQLMEKGFVIGGGYGEYKDQHLRFSNFPTHSKEQVEMLTDIVMML